MWHTNQQHLGKGQAKASLSASPEAFPLHILLSKELKEQRKHISKSHTKEV